MTKIIIQNYAQLSEQLGLLSFQTLSYKERLDQIFKDLNRLFFIDSDRKTFQDCINTWTSAAAFPYIQGNMDASIASLLLKRMYYGNPLYPEPPRIMDFSFSYFDDNGKICALSISYLSNDPKGWVGAVIQNASSGPKSTMNLIGSDELMNGLNADPVKDNEIRSLFLKSIHSRELEKLLTDLILKDGSLDIEQLEKLNVGLEDSERASVHQQMVENKKSESEAINDYFNKRYFSSEIKNLEDKKSQVDSQSEEISRTKQKDLEALLIQPFHKRHINKLRFMALASLPAISLLLVLSGVLAPLGVGLAFMLLSAALVVNVLAILLTGIKMGLDAYKLFNYQRHMEALKNNYDHLDSEKKMLQIEYDMKRANMDPLFEGVCNILLQKQLFDKTDIAIKETIDYMDASPEELPIHPSPLQRSKSFESHFEQKKESKSKSLSFTI